MTSPAKRQEPDQFVDPRTFAYLSTDDVIVDPRRQREVSPEKIAKIAHTFDWSQFEVLTVAPPVVKGKEKLYHVIEGQHRAMAVMALAKKIGRPILVPAMIVPKANEKQQADIALTIVRTRRGHSAVEQWHLAVNAGYAHEVFAQVVLDDLHLRIGRSATATTIAAAATVRNIVYGGRLQPEYGAELLRSTLDVIMEAFPTHDSQSNTTRWDRFMLLAVAWIVHHNERLDRSRLANSLKVRPAMQWINIGKGADQLPVDVAMRQAIVIDYNKGLRSNKIEGGPGE
jgi:hypothetical protein